MIRVKFLRKDCRLLHKIDGRRPIRWSCKVSLILLILCERGPLIMLEIFCRNYLDVKIDKAGNKRVVVRYRINDFYCCEQDIDLGTFKTVFEALKSLSNNLGMESWKVIASRKMISQSELVISLVDSCSKSLNQWEHHHCMNSRKRNPKFREKGFMMSPERMIERHPYLQMVKIHSHLSIVWSNEWKAMIVGRFSTGFVGPLYRSLGIFRCFSDCVRALPNVMGIACIQDKGCGLEEMIGVFETITTWVEANREWIGSQIMKEFPHKRNL